MQNPSIKTKSKNISTSITMGQIVFIFFFFVVTSFMSFYFGARFGRSIFQFPDKSFEVSHHFLPNEHLEKEIEEILSSSGKFIFYETVEHKEPNQLKP